MAKTTNTKKNSGKSTTQKTAAQKKQTFKQAEKTQKNTSTKKKAAEVQAPRKQEKPESSFVNQAAPYLMAVFAVLIAVCVIMGEGTVGGTIRDVLTGLFAGAAYALPVFILIRTFLWKRDIAEGQNTGRNICTFVVFILLAALLHTLGGGEANFDIKTHYADGMDLIGGGVVGGVIGQLLVKGFGKVCTLIIIFAAMILLALYIAGITPRGVYIYVAYKIKFASERREERRAAEEEKRRNAPPSKNQIREEEYLEYLRAKKKQAKLDNDIEPYEQQTVFDEPVHTPKVQPNAATVYRVKKQKRSTIDPTTDPEAKRKRNVNNISDSDYDDDIDSPSAEAEEIKAVPAEAEELPLDQETVDEKIFDEVMRRTRERIEKSQKKNGGDQIKAQTAEELGAVSEAVDPTDAAPADTTEIVAGDVLDAVEMAAMSIREQKGNSHTSKDDTHSKDDGGEYDVSKIFVNPEDAEMIDKISEAHNTLDVHRESLSGALPKTQKPTRPSAPVYKFPPIEILAEDPGRGNENIKEELQSNAVKLVETLKSFNVKTKIENISRGPTITRYELLPEPGTRVRSIVNLVDDIALNLATTGVRIEAPIPGKSAVGIEVPNKNQSTVHLRTLIEDSRFIDAKSKLTVCLGENVAGEAMYFDIAKMPHLLIAGATGMGKSVCINSVITSLLYKASPEEVRLILIDPKKVELSIYNGIPHLLVPVVSEPKKAAGSLSWAVGEMERRFGLIEAVGVRDIRMFNEVTKNDPDYEYMPRIVIIIDELADLMMTAPDDVEESICRLAQKARAAGMHLIIGTQRPSVDVITGLIKANIPSRIAFTVSSQIDSRTIIDRGGAENLIGRGDMLFNPVGAQKPMRVQGAFISESDVEEVVSYIKNMNASFGTYSDEVANQIEREAQKCGVGGKKGAVAGGSAEGGDDEDPMLKSAVELAIESGKISTSLIQRRLSLGYGRAAKLIDRMEQLGYVSAPDGQKPREVLISKQEYMEMRLKDEAPFDM